MGNKYLRPEIVIVQTLYNTIICSSKHRFKLEEDEVEQDEAM